MEQGHVRNGLRDNFFFFLHHLCLAYRLQPFLLYMALTPVAQTIAVSRPDDYRVKLSA